MLWRLGADLGTNSLGWAALELEPDDTDKLKPIRILAAGSRIFSDGRDPKSGASLAVDRRDARAMRRRRDRFQQRQRALIEHLTRDGLFPEDEAARDALKGLDPFELRARALDEALPLHHIGRAFFHLNQRRGFKSNRKADRGADDDAGKIAVGIDRLKGKIAESGARTFGEFLHLRRSGATDANAIPSVRTRLRPEAGADAKGDGYDFYPGRQLIEEEFEAIWEAQTQHHVAVLTPEVHDRLHEIVFHQRPLKAPKIGTCTLEPGEKRLAKAHPLFQRRRLLEELNALMIVRPGEKAQRLTPDERDRLFLRLKDAGKVSFQTLRKELKLDPDARFNKESENRTDLKGDEVAALMGTKTRFGKNDWAHLSWEQQWEVVDRLGKVESDEEDREFRTWLEATHRLTPEQAKAVVSAHLPQGYGRFGQTATETLIAALKDGRDPDGRVIVYSEAVALAGYHHSDFRSDKEFDKLPYYGVALERHIMPGTGDPSDPEEMRIGRLTNPTVHIGLNQLRRVVNRLIRTYGPPAEIAIELARELKQTDEDKKRQNQENNRNRLAAEQRGEKLGHLSQRNSGANRALLRLWEELDGDVIGRQCVYTGQVISPSMLFDGRAEVDHILPFTATLDDSNANKIVCIREANREKRKRSPYEAWGHTSQWEEIAARAARLPRNKRWRFEPGAMEKRDSEEDGFLARHLKDTQYLSRLAREYLASLYPGSGEESSRVWVSPGRLTEMVRRKLGLNDLLPDHNYAGADQAKNRLDHRHHAIDAAVIAIVDRGMLQKIAHESGLEGAEGRERIIIPEPWDGFRNELRDTVNNIVVSHRTDHGTVAKAGLPRGRDATAGRLHNDTAYGLTGDTDSRGNSLVVHRVPLTSLKKASDIDGVRDAELKAALYRFTQGLDGKAFEEAIGKFSVLGPLPFRGIRRLRVVEPLTVIPIKDRNGRIYKGYKGDSNYRYDVWEMPDGKWITNWNDQSGRTVSSVVSMFDAHQTRQNGRPHPAARKVLSLHQNDLIAIERGPGQRELMRVTQFWQNGQVRLVAHNEAGKLEERNKSPDDPYKNFSPTCGGLKKARARQVRIDEIGRIFDPGFPARTAIRRTRSKT